MAFTSCSGPAVLAWRFSFYLAVCLSNITSAYRAALVDLVKTLPLWKWRVVIAVDFPIFFRLLLFNCLNWKIYCDHSSLPSTTAVRIWTISYKLHTLPLCNKRVLYLSRITWRSLTLFPMMINRPSSAYQQTLSVRRRESSAHRWVSRTTNDVVLHCAVYVLYVIC